MRIIMIKYLGNIRRNYKFRSLILCSECVTCYDFIRQGVTEGKRNIKRFITAVHNLFVYTCRYTEVSTDLHHGNVIVLVIATVTWVFDYSCKTVKCSTRIKEIGASSHRKRAGSSPVDSKITT